MALVSARPSLKSLNGLKPYAESLEAEGVHSPSELIKRFAVDGPRAWAAQLKILEGTEVAAKSPLKL